jgi:hydrogenase-4 component E
MTAAAQLVLLTTILVDLYLTASSRVGAAIRAAAVQGVALSLLPLALEGAALFGPAGHPVRLLLVTAATLTLKAIVIPLLLLKTMRSSGVRREFAPFVTLHVSLLIGAGLIGLGFWVGGVLAGPGGGGVRLALSAGCATLLVGLYLTISRRKALSQVIGYLVAENGLFAIGLTLPGRLSWLVELGVLLDVLVAVMVMTVLVVRVDGIMAPGEEEGPGARAGADGPGGAR